MMDHNAIYKAYADTVVRISDSQGAFDADGNSVEIDQALADAARSELDVENAWSDLRPPSAISCLLQLTGRSSSTKS